MEILPNAQPRQQKIEDTYFLEKYLLFLKIVFWKFIFCLLDSPILPVLGQETEMARATQSEFVFCLI